MKNRVLKSGIVLASLLVAMFLAYCANQGDQQAADQNAAQPGTAGHNHEEMIQRGAYLVTFGGCNDCHTPKIWGQGPIPELDTARLLSGHPADKTMPTIAENCLSMQGWVAAVNADFTAWNGPWGVSFAANLTPDEVTGLGTWTEDVFISTIRNGKHLGTGRDILPPMPWPMYAQMTDDDLKAIFAYLQSLKPVNNQVPQPIAPAGATAGGSVGSTN